MDKQYKFNKDQIFIDAHVLAENRYKELQAMRWEELDESTQDMVNYYLYEESKKEQEYWNEVYKNEYGL